MSKLRFKIPELHYQTVEVEWDRTIGDALREACFEGTGTNIGDVEYVRGLDVEDFPVKMLDENGEVEASYWYDQRTDTWVQMPPYNHGG